MAKRAKLEIWALAAQQGWTYSGDMNLENGGYFWKWDGGPDYVEAVDVSPASDGGGPDNLFEIRVGSIYLPSDNEERWRALDCCGEDRDFIGPYTLAHLVEATRSYAGMDSSRSFVVRIGKVDPLWSDMGGSYNPEPHRVLRGNAKLANHVVWNFLT